MCAARARARAIDRGPVVDARSRAAARGVHGRGHGARRPGALEGRTRHRSRIQSRHRRRHPGDRRRWRRPGLVARTSSASRSISARSGRRSDTEATGRVLSQVQTIAMSAVLLTMALVLWWWAEAAPASEAPHRWLLLPWLAWGCGHFSNGSAASGNCCRCCAGFTRSPWAAISNRSSAAAPSSSTCVARGQLNGHGAVLERRQRGSDRLLSPRRPIARRGRRRRSIGWPPTTRRAAATVTCRCATSNSIRSARRGAIAAPSSTTTPPSSPRCSSTSIAPATTACSA